MIPYEYNDTTLWFTEEEYFDTTEEQFENLLMKKYGDSIGTVSWFPPVKLKTKNIEDEEG